MHTLEHVLIGTVTTDAGPRWVYDALHDKDVTPLWLSGIRDASEDPADSGAGPIRFVRYSPTEDIPVGESSLVLSGEQSNTSMVFGDRAIMKFFRRLQPGVNPDIEIQGELSKLGARNIARLLGAVELVVDGEPELAGHAAGVHDQRHRRLGAGEGQRARPVGRGGPARRRGRRRLRRRGAPAGLAVAEVHADLATAFGGRAATAEELQTRSQQMLERLRRAVDVVPELSDVADGLARTFTAFGELPGGPPLQRIHGDLHLGQALRTVYRWVLIDFEGEPAAAIEARRGVDFVLRDVAGMLRSFEYAGHHRVVDLGADPQLSYRATEWSERNRTAFCDGYSEVAGNDPREHNTLLRAFEADKAVYEAVYEARNRPTWLPIPLASLARLATDGGTS